MNNNTTSHILVLIATFIVGGSFIASQKLSGVIDPISITLLRFVLATIFLAPFVIIKKQILKKLKSTFLRAMIISFFYSMFFVGLFVSLEYTTALNTGTIFTLVPLLTAIISIFVFKQFITLQQIIVYILASLGTCMVVFRGSFELFLSLSLNYGDLIFLLSILFMSLYSVSSKYLHKKDDELVVLVFLTLFGGCIWTSFAILFMNIPLQWDKINSEHLYYLFYLSIAATLLTSFLYQKSTIILGSKKVMAYVYLNPATIVILLILLEERTINAWMLLGIVISSFSTAILLTKIKN